MEEIRIKGNEGVIRFDHNNKTDLLCVTAVDNKGHADSHHIFNQGTISNCCCLAYIRTGGHTKFYSDRTAIHPCEYDIYFFSIVLEKVNNWSS